MTVTQDPTRPPDKGAARRVLGMIIAARHRRVLSEIECTLGRTDQRLTSKFNVFSRLTSGEEMPWIEQVRPRRPRRPGNVTRIGRLLFRMRVVLFVGVAVGVLATALVMGGAFARRVPVNAAQDYSMQSGGATHRRHTAGKGLMAGPPRPRTSWREPAAIPAELAGRRITHPS
jgi:hypothetical protein